MTDVGYLAAFLGGLLALLSPCSALLLPAFFAYSLDSAGRLLARTGVFYLGLASTLVPLGAAGSYAGRLFYGHRDLLVSVGGWLIIALGVIQLLGRGFAFGGRLREISGRIRPTTALSVYALGAVYGLAGFCAGPILGSVLTVAAVGGNPVYGGMLLAVYALGMAVPLFLLALVWDRYDLGGRRWLRGREVGLGRFRAHSTTLFSGCFFILLGTVFLVFDGTSALPGLLDTDTAFTAESWAGRIGNAVPDGVLLLAVLLVPLAGWGGARLRRKRARGTDAGDSAPPDPDSPSAATDGATEGSEATGEERERPREMAQLTGEAREVTGDVPDRTEAPSERADGTP
ncbi:cytochrome c biogenesis protein CcdA [Streptomyces sp. AJS327]|uniref:cytochrome c biogenesis CcdA family protein n=1 Tax=Streptomyces sp. AJS327 TaxID=2545265 RepID=UPI0015DF02A1|nr:cytochrome c biogenesis CcdA family protein [Streptomyces sp. AJS327]MBA0053598.1 cytochrome c biogenesis protein CcdA [Streptomyces sp. AJS327]